METKAEPRAMATLTAARSSAMMLKLRMDQMLSSWDWDWKESLIMWPGTKIWKIGGEVGRKDRLPDKNRDTANVVSRARRCVDDESVRERGGRA